MAKYDILISSAGSQGVAISCLRSIREHSKDYRVVWFDNGGPPDVHEKVVATLKDMPHIRLRAEANIGAWAGRNVLLIASTAPYAILLDDDTEAVPGWLENVERLFAFEKVAIASPCLSQGVGRSPHWAGTWNAPRDDYKFVPDVGAQCMWINRETLDQFGVFAAGYWDAWDTDYCYRVRKAGYKIAVDLRTVVIHKGGITFGPMEGVTQEQARKYEGHLRDVEKLHKLYPQYHDGRP